MEIQGVGRDECTLLPTLFQTCTILSVWVSWRQCCFYSSFVLYFFCPNKWIYVDYVLFIYFMHVGKDLLILTLTLLGLNPIPSLSRCILFDLNWNRNRARSPWLICGRGNCMFLVFFFFFPTAIHYTEYCKRLKIATLFFAYFWGTNQTKCILVAQQLQH